MKVLSVDFDVIMGPDIDLYNPKVPVYYTLEQMIAEHPLLTGLRIDFEHYQKLVNILLEVSQNIEYQNIYVAYSHDSILDFLKNDSDLELVNIDHHHDLGYDEKNNFEKATYANWVYYLFKQGKIKKYTWLQNVNSGIMPPDKEENCFFHEFFYNITKDNYIEQFGYPDKIFICLSPEWVPEHCFPLFCTLLDVLNKQNNYTLSIQ